METLPVTITQQRAMLKELELDELESLAVLVLNELRRLGVERVEWPQPWMRPLLEMLAENGVINWCMRELKRQGVRGVSATNVKRWRSELPEFDDAMLAAMEEGNQVLLGEAVHRALGYDEPLAFKGRLTGDMMRKVSDNLLMFVIKARYPEYRDNRGKGAAGDVKVSVEVAPLLVIPDNGREGEMRPLEVAAARKLLAEHAGKS